RAGECISTTLDEDGDGVPALTDCDDNDASIGTTASRSCATACGSGTEMCTMGEWGACSAPSEPCSCTEGETQSVPCGNCGTQMQRCSGNTWLDEGACEGGGECAAGSNDSGGP